jgi:hypothetical protein
MNKKELALSRVHELINREKLFCLSKEQIESVFLNEPETGGDPLRLLLMTEQMRNRVRIRLGIELCKQAGIGSIYADLAYSVINKSIFEWNPVKFKIKEINEIVAWDLLLYEGPDDNQVDYLTEMSSKLLTLLYFGHPCGNHEFTSVGEFRNIIEDISIIESLDLRKVPARLFEYLEEIRGFVASNVNNYKLITSIVSADGGPLERLLARKK